MKFSRRAFMGASIAAGGALFTPHSIAAPTSAPLPTSPVTPAGSLPPIQPRGIYAEAFDALGRHAAQITHRDRLAIADYSAHSGEFRFHIVNAESGETIRSLLVSHGRGSDPANTGFVQRFSNVPGSYASSRGSYVTGEEYVGKHGRSRRLHGLEPDNSRAFERAIVIHGADYVDHTMAESSGRVGRSLGCFAFEQSEISHVIELLGPGRLLFAAGQST